MIVDAIAEWQYLMMGTVGCTLIAIALQAIYIYNLHHKIDATRTDTETHVDAVRNDLIFLNREMHALRNDHYWRQP